MPASELQLQYNSVRGYLSAIRKLFEIQQSQGVNPAARPDGVLFKVLLQSILRTKAFKKRQEFADRGAGTIKDSYLPSQIPDYTAAVWKERGGRSVEGALRTQLDFLLGNHLLLRYSNRGPLELPDCFCLDLPKEGHQPGTTKCLVVILDHGKTNQHGRIDYHAALRHRDPFACIVGSMAFYFFLRWQAEKREPFPSFQTNEDWYNIKVLRRSAAEYRDKAVWDEKKQKIVYEKCELSYQTAKNWTRRYHADAGIKTSKATHAGRVAGSQNADAAGVAEGQVNFSPRQVPPTR